MRIRCPFCGERDSSEFTVAGDASCRRPDADWSDAQAAVFDAVYLRDNLAGRHIELWYHSPGCRSWLHLARDTCTHEVFGVSFAREATQS